MKEKAYKMHCGEVWGAPCTTKIGQHEINYTDKREAALFYQAVRNEYESNQLIITAGKDIASFKLKVADLKKGKDILSRANVEVYVQKYSSYNENVYGEGTMPDALIPMKAADTYRENEIKAGTNGALWITIYIPKSTKAGVYLGNDFGATQINKDKRYIAEGKGSWRIQPQGDYGIADRYPFFRMRCKNTTFKTNNFSGFESVSMEIYNSADREIQIQWGFEVLDKKNNLTATETKEYTLQPNGWTTCKYSLTGKGGDLDWKWADVKYMQVAFLWRKQKKDDVAPVLYVDNVCGNKGRKKV